jgi:hypothetical protein
MLVRQIQKKNISKSNKENPWRVVRLPGMVLMMQIACETVSTSRLGGDGGWTA